MGSKLIGPTVGACTPKSYNTKYLHCSKLRYMYNLFRGHTYMYIVFTLQSYKYIETQSSWLITVFSGLASKLRGMEC